MEKYFKYFNIQPLFWKIISALSFWKKFQISLLILENNYKLLLI